MKKTSQRSLLFRQNVNRTEAEWVFRGACPQRDYDAGYYAIMDASGMKLSYPIISALDISQTISSR